MSTLRSKGSSSNNGKGFGDVSLHPSILKRIEQLANATANTKFQQAPFLNMLFYGPPGTAKTMAAKELARKSGLDYALMNGDVAPLRSQAVTKIHQLFDWQKVSERLIALHWTDHLCTKCYALPHGYQIHSHLPQTDVVA